MSSNEPITFRGETYTNNRTNREFVRNWGRFFARNREVACFDHFSIHTHNRPADGRERSIARSALAELRRAGYYTR